LAQARNQTWIMAVNRHGQQQAYRFKAEVQAQ